MISHKVAVIFCQYYLDSRAVVFLLEKIRRTIGSDIELIVDNRPMESSFDSYGPSSSFQVMRGSNYLYDIGAYLEGLQSLDYEFDYCLLVNDSLFIKWPSSFVIEKIASDLHSIPLIDEPVVIGFSGEYQYVIQSNPWSGERKHLCTAAFCVNNAASKVFMETVSDAWRQFQISNNKNLDEMRFSLKAICGHKFYSYVNMIFLSSGSRIWGHDSMQDVDAMKIKKAICFYIEHKYSGLIDLCDGGSVYVNRGRKAALFRFYTYMALIKYRVMAYLRK